MLTVHHTYITDQLQGTGARSVHGIAFAFILLRCFGLPAPITCIDFPVARMGHAIDKSMVAHPHPRHATDKRGQCIRARRLSLIQAWLGGVDSQG